MTSADDVGPSSTVVLPLAVASSRLGISVDALRSRIRRGAVTARRGNDGRLLVEVPAEASPRQDLVAASSNDELAAEVDYLRAELMHTLERAARAEERAVAVRELADRLTQELLDARRELAETRRPWWRRLVG